MAKFKLGLLIQDIVQTPGEPDKLNYIEDIFTNFNFNNYYFDYETRPLVVNENQEYIHEHKDEQGNTVTEKYLLPMTAINNNIDFSYSYDESVTFKEHSQKQLQFKMLKYVQYNGDFLINPYAAQITNGSLIILYDKFENISYFIVTKISYSIKNANVEISYDCQDIFSYIHTRQNSGYTIVNDETKENFIGALKIDEWTNKIVDDCKIAYKYLPLTATIYKGYISDNQYELSTQIQSNWNNGFTILRDPLTTEIDDLYNAAITFAISNSNALNALIQLAEQRGLNIQVDDKTNCFYFIPAKAEEFSGLYYSPQIDLSDLSISQQAQSLTTVLNVTGQILNNTEITLLPKIPSLFLTLFSSNKWENDTYKPGYFQDFVNNQTKIKYGDYTYIRDSSNDLYIIENADHKLETIIYKVQIPFGNYETIQIDPTFTINLENNDILTFEELVRYSYIDSEHTKIEKFSIDYSSSEALDLVGNYEYDINTNGANLQQSVYLPCTIIIQLQAHSNLSNIQGLNASVSFNRTSTVEEEEFARMADRLPWLENKLINLDYFYRRQLLSQNDYSLLLDKLYNELRIVNGKMIYYNNLYYAALLDKTNVMVELQNTIDVYMADFTYYLEGGSAASSALDRAKQSFEDLYNFANGTIITKFTLLTLEKTLEQYVNNYYQYEQLFYKNIYKFRQKWNDKVYFTVQNATIPYITYQDFTLGKFYETYKKNSDPILQQQAALIGTELQEYWDAAYSASKYCGWYLPESFEDSVHTIYNGSYNLSNTYLPVISLYEETYYQGHINVNYNHWYDRTFNYELPGEMDPAEGRYVWYNDNDVYMATNSDYQKWNKDTNTWMELTRNQHCPSLNGTYYNYYGSDVWYYQDTIFCHPQGNNKRYSIFDKTTQKWGIIKEWPNNKSIDTMYLCSFQNQVYYLYYNNYYYLYFDTEDSNNPYKWLDIVCKDQNNTILDSLVGNCVWTDHLGNAYYSENDKQYKFVKREENILYWEEIGNNNLKIGAYNAENVWYYKNNTFFSYDDIQYKLNENQTKWIPVYWQGLTSFRGCDVWHDNKNTYIQSATGIYINKILNNINYITNIPISSYSYVDQAFDIDYLIVDDRHNSNSNTDFKSYLSWTPYTNISKINYYEWNSGGKKWNTWRTGQGWTGKIADTRLPIGGIWVILIHILLNKYYPQQFTELEEITEKHNNIWRELYQNYGNYLLENSYTDNLATNSEDLYNATMAFFKDQCTPEKSYDLSIIDIYALKGYTGQEIKVTDQIRIASQDFYQELDELKDILDQTLFIKEIQYKLRSDTDIKLSVNIVKYQDKMIKRLVNLIR